MKYRKLDSNGDMVFGSSNNFYEGTTAVAQAIYTSIKLLYGEWWEDTSQGLPLFQQILGKAGTQEDTQSADLILQDCINQVEGVLSIIDFSSSYANRIYSASCTVQTPYGNVTVPIQFSF